jgi:single-strand DNA-binding protein
MKNLRNSVTLIGHLGDEPKIYNFDSGSKKAVFSIATNESYKKDGEKVEATEWHNIVAWGAQAGFIEKYLKKGSFIAVEGRLTTNKWEDKEGKKQYRTEISLNELTFLEGKKKTA